MISYIDYNFRNPFDLEAEKKINEIVDRLNTGAPNYTTEESFVDHDIQNASGLDVPTSVQYGATKVSPSGAVSYDGILHEFTINTTGYYLFKSRLRAGRTGASGTSMLFFWAEISIDGGSNWNVTGNAVDVSLEKADDVKFFFDASPLYLPAGVKLRTMFARSSTGDNSGGLIPSEPSATLMTYGLGDSPSAQITVYKTTP